MRTLLTLLFLLTATTARAQVFPPSVECTFFAAGMKEPSTDRRDAALEAVIAEVVKAVEQNADDAALASAMRALARTYTPDVVACAGKIAVLRWVTPSHRPTPAAEAMARRVEAFLDAAGVRERRFMERPLPAARPGRHRPPSRGAGGP